MKRVEILMAVLTTMVAVNASAYDGKGKKDPKVIFEALDENGDGYLNLDEFSKMEVKSKSGKKVDFKKLLKKKDSDGDSVLSLENLVVNKRKNKKRGCQLTTSFDILINHCF